MWKRIGRKMVLEKTVNTLTQKNEYCVNVGFNSNIEVAKARNKEDRTELLGHVVRCDN